MLIHGIFLYLQNSSYSTKLETRKLRLKQLKDKCSKEESEWVELLQQYENSTNENQDQIGQNVLLEAAKKGRDSIEKDSLKNSIASACVTTNGKLGLAVDALCSMVDSVRRICSETDAKSREITREFHKESFKMFPHIESPLHLVSQLSKK